MWFNPLEDHDYKVLESYWINFKSLVETTEQCPRRLESIESIVAAVTTLYNASEGLSRDFIEKAYFHTEIKIVDQRYLASELGTTNFKITVLRKSLLKDTAKLIGWV